MCPDSQLLSIYLDGELPSPWKEKMETHLSKCNECREKLVNFRQLRELLKKETHTRRTVMERIIPEPTGKRSYSETDGDTSLEEVHSQPFIDSISSQNSQAFSAQHSQTFSEHEVMEISRDKVWQKLESRQRTERRSGLWRRRLSVPLPAAAAAAVFVVVVSMLWVRAPWGGVNNFANQSTDIATRSNIILAAEEEMPGILPVADLNSVLQFLGTDGTEVLILRLPEHRNFFRAGEPAIINAADYRRNEFSRAAAPQTRRQP